MKYQVQYGANQYRNMIEDEDSFQVVDQTKNQRTQRSKIRMGQVSFTNHLIFVHLILFLHIAN